ncbi:MAG TPA: PVC-type heme-binding CxxCH protein, partial [Candidatus Binatia bacterium]|nr:PVC-type heme-binding CxxCH protein [Candidatus Binatia bacterium]
MHTTLLIFALVLPFRAAEFIGAPEPPKSPKSEPLTPEEERAAFTLPPGFEIELIASELEGIGKFVTVDWDLQGRMWSMTALEYPVDANENPATAKALYSSFAKDKVLVWDSVTPEVRRGLISKPHVFADGLAIPLGILPYKNGVYVQHGSDIVFLSDTDGDGKADKREVILTGFGVQDSHLFPHQFTRAPGNWIWMAQGAFNYGKVRTTKGSEQQFDQTRMARFRYDGSDFDITSQGPCNIWGLVINGEGEVFIQEANDYGYPVMPFHAYANYPGCSDAQWKSYAPEFPGTAPDFRMGGTGLSGLALSDAKGAWPEPYADVMYLANPIVRKIQAIKIHRDGPRYRLEKLPDFIQSSDEMFRPVAMKTGPDGCLYIVDWYNKIISHNEVPRNHPDRDKKRGRIWRVKHRDQKPFPVPDFTKLSGDELLAKLGGESLTQSHLAWQAITDRQLTNLITPLRKIVEDNTQPAPKRIASLWALEGLRRVDVATLKPLLSDTNRNVRREAVRAFGESKLIEPVIYGGTWQTILDIQALKDDPDSEVREEVIRVAAAASLEVRRLDVYKTALELVIEMARPSLPQPIGKSTHSGKTIKLGEAYEREFERYLARLFLEKQPKAVAAFLDSRDARRLPLENRMLATLALEPKASASRIAKLVPDLSRPPNEEELLRLAQFPEEPGVSETLKQLVQDARTLDALLKVRTKFDATKVASLLEEPTRKLLAANNSELGLRVASGFKLTTVQDAIEQLLQNREATSQLIVTALRTLRELNVGSVDRLASFVSHPDKAVRDEAILALASSRNEKSVPALIKLWPDLTVPQRRTILDRLSSTKTGAQSVVSAVKSGAMERADLDSATLDKLATVLRDDAEFMAFVQRMSVSLRPALRLNGNDDDWLDSDITLDGAFTVETWIKLDSGISNSDGILGAPGVLD